MGLASASETSLAGRAERARIKAQRKEERAQADAANQQNASDGTAASLVDDKNAISMDDVMSYAGGLQRQALFSIALVLFVIIMLINIVLNVVLKGGSRD